MKHTIIDASALAALYLQLPWSARLRAIVGDGRPLSAPELVLAELGNTFWKNVRAGVLQETAAAEALRHVRAGIDLQPIAPLLESALSIAIERDHPIYDCLYVALAQREDTPLVTADRRLATMAHQRGVVVERLGP